MGEPAPRVLFVAGPSDEKMLPECARPAKASLFPRRIVDPEVRARQVLAELGFTL